MWIYDLDADTTRQLTDYDGTDNQPVWVGDTIYFASDREEGRLNLFSYDVASGAIGKVTDHEDFDVLWPSAGPEQIVYESGGFLYRYQPATGASEKISLDVTGDFRGTMPRTEKVSGLIHSATLSPTGKRALLTARGDVFTVPAEHGVVRNLTRTPGVREMAASWSPDGRWVAYLSDRTGEYEVWVRARDGSGDERQLTRDGDTWLFAPAWSPDSKKIAFGDRHQRLRWIDVASGAIADVDTSNANDITDYRWSPDSRWLVYTKVGETQFSSVYLHSLDGGESHRVTDEFTNDYQPVFGSRGPLPLLSLRSGLEPDVQRLRVQTSSTPTRPGCTPPRSRPMARRS